MRGGEGEQAQQAGQLDGRDAEPVGVGPDDLDDGGVQRLVERPRVVVPRADVEAFADLRGQDLFAPLREAGRLDVVDGDAVIGRGVRVVATPGHTPGHQCVLVSDGDQRLLVTGDLLVHAIQLLHPELAYAHDMDAGRARASREAMLARGGEWAVSHLGPPFVRART